MVGTPLLARDRIAHREWAAATACLEDAAKADDLDVEGLELLAAAACLAGRDELSVDAWGRAYQTCREAGQHTRAARCAFWAGLGLLLRGDHARGGGWLGRAGEAVQQAGIECAEQGYLMLPAGVGQLATDPTASQQAFQAALEIGRRFADADLIALARLGCGQAAVRCGDIAVGTVDLDAAMLSVTSGEVSPVPAGLIYCAVIETCQEMLDLRRAREWTVALTRWCDDQPDLVPYRGQCLVYRAEIMQRQGAWEDAFVEARRACGRLGEGSGHPAVGMAFYRLGEMHRLRGELDAAEGAYREANRWGFRPQPGLALVRLAQGQAEAAAAALQTALGELSERGKTSELCDVLVATVEATVACGAMDVARAAVNELAVLAGEAPVPPAIEAMYAHATATLRLAEGSGDEALTAARLAWSRWRDLDVPYEAARARVLVGRACRAHDDDVTARMEFDAAATVFLELGATTDLAAVNLLNAPGGRSAGRLSPRETQVLALVATGATNRAIAAHLVLSERTVDRHVSNILAKLDLATRSAATAYAHRHGLL